MVNENIALAILQAAVALAGLVLIYSGFMLNKATGYTDTRKAKKFTSLAKWALAPTIMSLFCSFIAVRALMPGHIGYSYASHWLLGVLR